MRILSATVTFVLMLWVGLRYCWLTIIGKTDPVFASWFILTVSVGLAFWTYYKTETHNLIDNIGNTVDLIVVLMILFTISMWGENVRAGFTWFEIANLVVAGLIVIFWIKSKNHFNSNLAIQVLMIIGYIPLMTRLATANENPEPWSVWIPIWVAAVFSMVPAYLPKQIEEGSQKKKKWKNVILPRVYATRATLITAVVLILMLRLELK